MSNRKAEWQNKYISKKYDRVNLLIEKGNKEHLQAYAKERGESLNSFINRAINEAIQRDSL